MSANPGPPAQYWIRNEQGRVWGPYTLAALQRMSGQLTAGCEVALDGTTFRPGSEFPELAELLRRQPAARAKEGERAPPPPPAIRIGRATAAAFNIKDGVVTKPGAGGDAPAAPTAEAPPAAPAAPAKSPAPAAPAKSVAPRPAPPAAAKPAAPPAPAASAKAPAAPAAQAKPPPAPASEPEVPAQGDLDAFSPVRLYALLALASATGLLRLALESGRALQIFFRRGVPEHLSSDEPDHSLPRFLQRRSALTSAQAAQAEEHARKTGSDPMSALFALQLIAPASAHQVMAEHAQFLLERALLCWRGTFTFARDAAPPPGAFPLGQRWTLLAEAVRRLEAPPLRARLGRRLQQPVVRSGGLGLGRLEELALNAQETRFFSGIDGTRTGDQLLETVEPALALRLLHLLTELGHLAFVGDVPRTAPAGEAAAPAAAAPPARPQAAPPRTAAELPKIAARPPPAPGRAAEPKRPPPMVGPAGAAPSAAPPRAPPPPAPPQAPSFAAGPAGETPEAQLRRLVALRDKLAKANHFEALGLQRKATSAEVKKAFFSVARDLHPDTVSDPAQQELRAIKEELFARVNAAAQVLSDEKQRKEYEQEMEGSNVDVARIFAAEEAFRKAEIMIKARKYAEGLELLEEALRLNGDEAEFYAWRGYARFMLAKDRKAVYAECVADCREALKRVERCLPAHLFLGHMAKVVGELKSASSAYQRVLDIDQSNIEAQRELRLLGKK